MPMDNKDKETGLPTAHSFMGDIKGTNCSSCSFFAPQLETRVSSDHVLFSLPFSKLRRMKEKLAVVMVT